MNKSIIIAAMLTLIACGNKETSAQADSDSTATAANTDNKKTDAAECGEETVDDCCCGDESEAQNVTEVGGHELLYYQFYDSFKVKGGTNIETFVTALSPVIGDFKEFDNEATMDKQNGYFHYFQEGAGSIRYDAALWKRDDGKKLFIISWASCGEQYAENASDAKAKTYHYDDVFYYFDSTIGENNYGMLVDFGHMAYLYEEKTQQLEPISSPLYESYVPNTPIFYELPQHGKDVKVRSGLYGDFTYKTARWNGTKFDKAK